MSPHADSTHTFSEHEDDWGFEEFLRVDKLKCAWQQFMPDGHLLVRVKLSMSGPATKGVHAPAQKPADNARARQVSILNLQLEVATQVCQLAQPSSCTYAGA